MIQPHPRVLVAGAISVAATSQKWDLRRYNVANLTESIGFKEERREKSNSSLPYAQLLYSILEL